MQTIASWADLDTNNHIFFNLVDEINQVTKPLKKHFSIDSFTYHKTYNDGSQTWATNQPQWLRYFLKNKLYLKSIFELPASSYSKNTIIYSHIGTHHSILAAAQKFDLSHCVVFIEPTIDGCEFYYLGTTTPNNGITIDKCLSNLATLEKFITNFNDLAQDILIKIEPFRVISKDLATNNHTTYRSIGGVANIEFLASISGYNLTKRELDCIPLLLKGHSSKQIANVLNISYRTVEIHINNLKRKTRQTSKNDLIHLLNEKFSQL